MAFQKAEYLLVSLEGDLDLLVGVVEDPESRLGSSARSACDISKAYVYLHTTAAYVPCAQLQTKTMREGPDSCGLLADPMDLLAASQTLANPVDILIVIYIFFSSDFYHLTHLKKLLYVTLSIM